MILTKVLEDPTGEYQFIARVEEAHEIGVLKEFYALWAIPENRTRILYRGKITIPIRNKSLSDITAYNSGPAVPTPLAVVIFTLYKANH